MIQDNEFLISLLQSIPRSATWMMLQPHSRTPGLSLTQLASDKSHFGSRSQQKAVRGFCGGIEPPSAVG